MQVPCNWDLLVWSWNWNICPRPYFQYDSGEIWLEECHEAGRINVLFQTKMSPVYRTYSCFSGLGILAGATMLPVTNPGSKTNSEDSINNTRLNYIINNNGEDAQKKRRRQTEFGDFYMARTLHQAQD